MAKFLPWFHLRPILSPTTPFLPLYVDMRWQFRYAIQRNVQGNGRVPWKKCCDPCRIPERQLECQFALNTNEMDDG